MDESIFHWENELPWEKYLQIKEGTCQGVICTCQSWFSLVLALALVETLQILIGSAEPESKLCARIEILVFVSRLPEILAFRLQMSGRKQKEYILPIFIQKV